VTAGEYGLGVAGSVGFDAHVPNVARIYDYLLGGKDHFAADREAAKQVLASVPGAAVAARANRRFLGRAVWHLARDEGVTQFLDIGTGLPTMGNVHEVAQIANRDARVVYCDNDPLVVVHANALMADDVRVAAVRADLRQPGHLLGLPGVRAIIDLDRPLAVLLVAVLHFVEDDEDPWGIVDAIRRELAPGSFVVISHVTGDEITADAVRQAAGVYQVATTPGVARSREDISRFFAGLDMMEPGLTDVRAWPNMLDGHPQPVLFYGGVGRVPHAAHTTSPGGALASQGRSWVTTLDGQRLRQLRQQHGLSQERLAVLAGISAATVARLERRPASSCRGRTLARLAAALGERPTAMISSASPVT